MLPVTAWPPGSPGASLSPFGRPRQVKVACNGYVIQKGAWIVVTGSANQVVMFYPPVPPPVSGAQTPGTGLLPGTVPSPLPPPNTWQPTFRPFNDYAYAPRVGRRPPNWFGWKFISAPQSTLVPPNASGLVLGDGQNVVITGSGCAQITQAYSV